MKYVGAIERQDTMTVDGYSNAKTINGAISEFGRYIVKHFSKSEGSALIENKQECLCFPVVDNEYFFTIEEVPCATQWNEESEEMEYADGNYYLCMRFVK
ncbi:hypothetical protein AALB39_04355 [Lachnospiraceae bacterium 54-53]